MRIVVMGTGIYAVPLLSHLYESSHEVVALFTRPERQRDSRGDILSSPMRQRADQEGTPVHAPENINSTSSHALLRQCEAELFIVCDYGQILKTETLELAPRGGFNLHASLLPKYRGAAPIHWAIYAGECETGNTVIQMTAGVDAGPIVAQQMTPIDPQETTVDLELRLAEMGGRLVVESVDALQQGTLQVCPQDLDQMTRAPKLKKADGKIDWTRSAQDIHNQIRAMVPWPKTFTHYLPCEGRALRLITQTASVITEDEFRGISSLPLSAERAGTVVFAEKDYLLVQTGHDLLRILQLQPSGKRLLSAEEFLRGYRTQVGDRFGSLPKEAR